MKAPPPETGMHREGETSNEQERPSLIRRKPTKETGAMNTEDSE
jgi:hypothetical protein